MNAQEVQNLIETEIDGDWSLTNLHGCDLKRCLVFPTLHEFEDHGSFPVEARVETIRLWLVLEECPEDWSGYKIVYSDVHDMFGLAVDDKPMYSFIGFYGTFLETYRAM
jgi:hypothetical protein